MLSRRWDLTPPTTATTQERRSDLRQILTEPAARQNGERRLEPHPPMQPPPVPHAQASTAPQMSQPPREQPALNNTDPREPQPLEPDDGKVISRPAEVRELSTDARCRSCVWNNRRCYVDQSNPRHCVSCRSREECIFRRTVIRDAPADFFTWPELVGVEHLPGGPMASVRRDGEA
jgi:hypothetical protein